MNKTVILITFLFIIMTGPGAVVSLLYDKLLGFENGRIIISFGAAFEMSYHAYSLLILYSTNKKFSNHLKRFLNVNTHSNDFSSRSTVAY